MRKKIALVTGGNRGIGFESCRQLARSGFTVLLTARDPSNGNTAVNKLVNDEGLDVIFYLLDVTNKDHIKNVSRQVEQQYGSLSVLINNAAILYDTWQHAIDVDLKVVNQAIDTNVYGPWRLCQAFIPIMKRNGHGRIVNVSSLGGSLHYMQEGGTPAYSISKAALNVLTRRLAAELQGTGILVNSIDPGWLATDMGGPGGGPVEEGVRGIIWAATLPEDGPSGGFFNADGRPVPW
jgi:NAD(P)-dependent dehydrogenase (short-subunit alcohol dehydrogenase family)